MAREPAAKPVGEIAQRFGEEELGALLGQGVERGAEYLAEAEAKHQHPRLAGRPEWRAGALRQLGFRLGREAADHLFTVKMQIGCTVVLVEFEQAAIRELRAGDDDSCVFKISAPTHRFCSGLYRL